MYARREQKGKGRWTIRNLLIYGMIYLGSALMICNIRQYIRFARQVRARGDWEQEQRILRFPILLLVFFSEYVGIFHVELSTTVAMLVSFLISLVFVAIHRRSVKEIFPLFGTFWQGMGNVFASVITLIVAAEIFSGGLISLGFIDNLVAGTTGIGLGGVSISIVITAVVFFAAMLMGSGNAAFFSFGPLVPDIAAQIGMPAVQMILPMQLAASMGRATSPIAGVIVAICGVAGVSPLELAKRNMVPLIIGVTCLTIIHFFI